MLTAIDTIVFATTLDPATRAVTRMAASLAVRYQARVILVHALEPQGEYGASAVKTFLSQEEVKRIREQGFAELQDTIRDKIDNFFNEEMEGEKQHLDLLAETIVKEGRPGDLVLDTAEKNHADLIVMGTRQPKGVKRLLIGSVARHVMENSSIPVLIIPL